MSEPFRIVGEFSKYVFSERLRYYRKKYNMTREELAKLLGKEQQQIVRYETDGVNLPPLDTFAKLCVILQIHPSELLDLKDVSIIDEPEAGFIYEWNMMSYEVDNFSVKVKKEIKLFWKCSICKKDNIEYNFKATGETYRCIESNMKCEHCFSVFGNILKDGSKIYRSIFK